MRKTEKEMKEIGMRIKTRRQSIGMSAAQLADLVGVHKTTIHRYEAGGMKEIKTAVLASLADALHVSTQWLLGETSDMRPALKQADICEMIADLKKTLLGNHDMTFSGTPADRQAVHTLIDGLDVIVSTAEKQNLRLQSEQALRSALINREKQTQQNPQPEETETHPAAS